MLRNIFNAILLSILVFGLSACDSKTNKKESNNTEVYVPIIDDNDADNNVTQNKPKPLVKSKPIISSSKLPNISPKPMGSQKPRPIISSSLKPSISLSPQILISPIHRPDKIAPIITLNGESKITLKKGESYIELGAKAIDAVDGNVNVDINGSVDSNVSGIYTITYTAIDKSNNKSILNRRVEVLSDMATTIKKLEEKLNDPSVLYTTETDYNQSNYAKHHLSDRELERLNRAHKLVSIAKDPDAEWFKTRSNTPVIIAKSGESYTVNLRKVNKSGYAYAPVDNDKLRIVVRVQRAKNEFEYITNININQYAYWDGAGILKINVPQNLNKGRILVGIRPNFDDVAVTAIAERWSTLISAEVWSIKDNIIIPDNKNVLFPIDDDTLRGLSPESLFSLTVILNSVQKSLKYEHALLLPIVIKDMNISKNDLISYDFKGKPYAGRVVQVIKKEQQTFALMSPEYFDIYEIMDLEEGFAEHEGLLPAHVIYREGDAFNTDVNESDPVTFDKRTRKKGGGGFFSQNCSIGKSEFTYSPTFSLYPLDAGVSIAIHALSKETKCTWKATTKKINLDKLLARLGPAGAVLEGIFGAGGELTPFGEVTVSVDQAPGFGVEAGYSLAKGGSFKVHSLAKTAGGIGSRDLTLFSSSAKGEIAGNVGMKFTIKALSSEGSIGIVFKWLRLNTATIGLNAEASVKEALTTNIYNATEVLNSSKSSDVAFNIGASAKVSATPDLKNLFNALSFKAKLEAKTPTLKLLEAKATAIHTFSSIDDDEKGNASVNGLILKSRYLQKLLSKSEGVLSPSDTSSSVYNDHTENISYDPDECDIEVPAIACSGWMCGSVENSVKLCEDEDNKSIGVKISAVVGEARVNKEAKVSGTITGKGEVSVSIEGSPLKPAKTSISLNDSSESIDFIKTCPAEPTVLRGKTIVTGISKDGKEEVTKEARNILVCHDDENKGDPHIVTGDGLGYDYYASGDYILSRITDITGYEIQGRFLPGYTTSWPQAVALQVGDDVVEIQGVSRDFHGDGGGVAVNALIIWVNGKRVKGRRYHNAYSIGRNMINLPSGGLIAITETKYNIVLRFATSITVVWPEGSKTENYGVVLNVASVPSQPFVEMLIARSDDFAGKERGLLGNNDGNPNNDFIRRNGEVLGVDHNISFTELYALFGTDWLVRPHESLFRNPEAIKPQFPTSVVTLTSEQRAFGERTCMALTGFYREACIIDVGLTGTADIVKEYYKNTEDLNELSNSIVTPSSDMPLYQMSIEAPIVKEGNLAYRLHYEQKLNIKHISGEGKFILLTRAPRGASVSLSTNKKSIIGEGNISTVVYVNCKEYNPETDSELYQLSGVVQLWAQDPLSGGAKYLYKEFPLSCIDKDYQPKFVDKTSFPSLIDANSLENGKYTFTVDVVDELYGDHGLNTDIFIGIPSEENKVSSNNTYIHDFHQEKTFELYYIVTALNGKSKTFSKTVQLINHEPIDYSDFPVEISCSHLINGKYTFDINVSTLSDNNLTVKIIIESMDDNKIIKTIHGKSYQHDFYANQSFKMTYIATTSLGAEKRFYRQIGLLSVIFKDNSSIPSIIDSEELVNNRYEFNIDVNSINAECGGDIIKTEIFMGKPEDGKKVSETNKYIHDFYYEKTFDLYYRVTNSLGFYKTYHKPVQLVNYKKIIDNSIFPTGLTCIDLVDGKYTFDINVTSPSDNNLSVKIYTRPLYGSIEEKLTEGTSFTLDFLKSVTHNVKYVVVSNLGEIKTYYKQISYTPNTFTDNTFLDNTMTIDVVDLDNGKYTFDINITTVPEENLNMEIFRRSTGFNEDENFINVSDNHIYEHDFLNGLKRFYLKYNVKTAGGCRKEYFRTVYLTGYGAIDHSTFPTDINASLLNDGKYTFDINVSSPLDEDMTMEIYKGNKYNGGIKVSDTNTYTHDFFRDHSFDLHYYIYNKRGEYLGEFKKHIKLMNYDFTDNTNIFENLQISDLSDGKYTFDINVSSSIDEDIEVLIEVRDPDTGTHIEVSNTNTYTHDFINGKKNFTLYYRVKSLAGYTHGIKNIKLVDYTLTDHSLFPNRIDIRDLVDGKYTFEMNITSPLDENLTFATYNINPEYGGDKVADGRFYTYDFNKKMAFAFHYGATTKSGYREMFYQYVRLKNDELIDTSTFPSELMLSDLDDGKYTFDLNLSSSIDIPYILEMYMGNPSSGGVKISDTDKYVHDFTKETSFDLYYKVIYPTVGYEKVVFKKHITLLTDKLTMFTKNQQYFLGKYYTEDIVFDIEVSEDRNLTFITEGKKGFTILDTSNILKPIKIGSYNTNGFAYNLILSKDESKIYLVDSEDGLIIIDISNTAQPELIANVAIENAYNITLSANEEIAYISTSENGIIVVDVKDSTTPIIKNIINITGICLQSILSSDETILYVVNGEKGLITIDISNLDEPTVLNTFVNNGYAYSATLSNDENKIFITDYIKGLQVLDISDIHNQHIIGEYEASTFSIELSDDNTKAYMGLVDGILILDISDLDNISLIKKYNTYTNIFRIKIFSDSSKIYAANLQQGFTIYDMANPPLSTIFSTFNTNGYAYGVALSYDEQKAYVTNGKKGLLSIDISDDNNFTLINSVETGDDARDIINIGESAYISNADSGFVVVDLIGGNLEIESIFDTDGWTHDIQKGNKNYSPMIYIADGEKGLKILKEDIFNEHELIFTLDGSCETEGKAQSLVVSKDDTLAYVVNHDNTMVVIDISNTLEPKIIGRWQNDNGKFEHITLSKDNKKLYIVDGRKGLLIVDISNPILPILEHSIVLESYSEMVVLTDNELLAYVTTASGIAMIDISNELSPKLVTTYPVSGYLDGMVLNKDETKAYIASGNTGLVGLNLSVDSVYYNMNFNTSNIEVQMPKGINVILDFDIKLDRTDIIQLGNYDNKIEPNEYKNAVIPIPIISKLGKTGRTKMTVTVSFGSIVYTRIIYVNIYK